MGKPKKIDLKKVVKKRSRKKVDKKPVRNDKPIKDRLPPLKEYFVKPVTNPKGERKKSKGAARNGTKKSKKTKGKKPHRGTNVKTKGKGEDEKDTGKKREVAIPDREKRKRGYYDWFIDGGRSL